MTETEMHEPYSCIDRSRNLLSPRGESGYSVKHGCRARRAPSEPPRGEHDARPFFCNFRPSSLFGPMDPLADFFGKARRAGPSRIRKWALRVRITARLVRALLIRALARSETRPRRRSSCRHRWTNLGECRAGSTCCSLLCRFCYRRAWGGRRMRRPLARAFAC